MIAKRRSFIFGTVLALGLASGPASFFGQTRGQDLPRGRISAPTSSPYAPPKLWERVEIVLFGGLGIPIAKGTTLHYAEASSASGLSVTAKNRIQTTCSPNVFAGATATFFLPSSLGIQAGFGYLKAGLESAGHFEWNSSGDALAAAVVDGQGEGELTAVPFFICFFNKIEFPFGQKILRAHLAAGPALSFNSVLTASQAGTGLIQNEKADGILVPVRVEDTTWISLGATAGVGLDIHLSPSLALAVEGRYYYAPRKNFFWTWTPGVYDGLFGKIAAYDFGDETAGQNERETTPLTVDPSFIQIAGGIKLIF